MTDASTPRAIVASRLREQADWCRLLGSPLYAALLERGAADVASGGPSWDVLAGHESDRRSSALALRFMGAVHRVVLEGGAPALARHYTGHGDRHDAERPHDAAWAAFRDAVAAHRERLRVLAERPVQTNDVGRCAALIGGFLTVAGATGLPLRLLEIGASAGLLLRWDRYYYETASAAWGDRASPVRLVGHVVAGRPPLDVAARVVERAGCDLDPIDPASDEGRLTLTSYLWPDQTERLALLRSALALAGEMPVEVTRADADRWLAARLARPAAGVATVVYHSIVLQYLGRERRARLSDLLAAAGARASRAAPLAWLRMEPGMGKETEVRLTVWPDGRERLVATAGFHGRNVRWLEQLEVPSG